MTATDLISRLDVVTKTASGWQARCPAHDDKTPSLSVTERGDRVLVHCHSGCTPAAICSALHLELSDLFNGHDNGHAKKIVATYDYHDGDGKLIFQVCRFAPKDFRQRRPDANTVGGWTWNTRNVERVLYRLPQIVKEIKRGHPVFVVEGEKDADTLAAKGFAATCNCGGAGKWRAEYSETLRGADVVIIPDKDPPGQEHAQKVAASLNSIAKRVRVLELPDVKGKPVKDASDFFTAGGDIGHLITLVEDAPDWTPRTGIATPDFESITADVRGQMVSILTDRNTSLSAQRNAISKLAVDYLCKVGRMYFHADLRDFDSALFFNSHTKRLERIRSDSFCAWLSDWLRLNRCDTIFRYVVSAIETAALSGERTTGIVPESFWASRPGCVYISNGDGALVKITASGFERMDNGVDNVLFTAGKTCAPWTLTEPRDIFQTCAIFRDAHTTASHAPDLLRAWVYSMPTNPRCKPPALFVGDVGAGKTAMAKAIGQLYGIAPGISKVEEMSETAFWPCVNDGGLYCLDNADTRTTWLADTISAAATDGTSKRRKLYCDAETIVLRPRAWLALTSCNPTFATDSGLADRLLLFRMSRRDDCDTSDTALADEIASNRDAGLSHLCAALSKALADTAPTPPRLNVRHPDFAAFAVRIGRACGRENEMIAALKAAENDKHTFLLENDSIAVALRAYLSEAKNFTGPAKDLRESLIAIDTELAEKLSAKRLGKRLNAIMPHLKAALSVACSEQDRKGLSIFTFKQ